MFTILVVAAVTFAASLAASYYIASQQPTPPSAEKIEEEDLSFPTVSEGKQFPVVFGTRDISDPVVAWYGNLQESEGNYSLTMILALCHAMPEAAQFNWTRLTRIAWSDRPVWVGDISFGDQERALVSAASLFTDGTGLDGYIYPNSGESGIVFGYNFVTVPFAPTGTWRLKGLEYVILSNVALGPSPSLKKPTFRVERLHTGWYDEKCAIAYDPLTYELTFVSLDRGPNGIEYAIHTDSLDIPELIAPLLVTVNASLFSDSAKTIPKSDALEVFIRVDGELAATSTYPAATTHAHTLELYIKNLKIGVQTLEVSIYTGTSTYMVSTVSDPVTQTMKDMNPAHAIRECLTDPIYGMGLSASDIDDVAFTYAADYLYTEKMGISVKWSKASTVDTFIKELCRHIDAAVFVDHSTGKFSIKLIRQDYNEASLTVLDKTNIVSVTGWKRTSFDDLQNTVSASYFNTLLGCAANVTVSDVALVQDQGLSITNSVDFPAFSNTFNASRAAQRQLVTVSTPLLACTITANLEAKDLDVGDAFKLDWPKYWPETIVMRVGKIDLGDTKRNRVTIEAVEDIFGTPASAYISR